MVVLWKKIRVDNTLSILCSDSETQQMRWVSLRQPNLPYNDFLALTEQYWNECNLKKLQRI